MRPSEHPDLCWLFVDTTGLDFMQDETIGLACKRGSFEFYGQLFPMRDVRNPEELRRINGYSADSWPSDQFAISREASDFVEARRALSQSVLAGHSLVWHLLFLRRFFSDLVLPFSDPAGRPRIELERIFAPLHLAGAVSGLSLGALAADCGVGLGKPANAWDKLVAATEIYDRWFEVIGVPHGH